jgi:hypothetical protein
LFIPVTSTTVGAQRRRPEQTQPKQTFAKHMSAAARSHVVEWVRETAEVANSRVDSPPSRGSVLAPSSYNPTPPRPLRRSARLAGRRAASPSFSEIGKYEYPSPTPPPREGRATRAPPSASARGSQRAASPTFSRTGKREQRSHSSPTPGLKQAPAAVTRAADFEDTDAIESDLPSYKSTPLPSRSPSPVGSPNPPPFSRNCSIAPSESISQSRNRTSARRRLRDGSVSPTFSNCSIGPSEANSNDKYDLAVRNHSTWKAHPYRNRPKPGEIIGRPPKRLRTIDGGVFVFEDDGSRCDSRSPTSSGYAAPVSPPHADTPAPSPQAEPSSPSTPRRASTPDVERPRLAFGMGSLPSDPFDEPITGDLSEGDNMAKVLDKIDRILDAELAKKE